MPFTDTSNKAYIRRAWDLPVLQRWHTQLQRPLDYFGLPGPEIHDLLDWRNLLGRRTGVESPGRTRKDRDQASETMGRLKMNVMVRGLSSGFELLCADVEDVILEGMDQYGTRPQADDGRPVHHARWQYDLVNLDFDGGLGYRDSRGDAKRITALKKLFERQAGRSFVLLLTINIRHTLGSEIDEFLRGLRERGSGPDWHSMLDWYRDRADGQLEYKLKAAVPPLIRAAAELHMFRSVCRPPIVYDGYKQARMLHFVFELEHAPGNLRAWSQQHDRELIQLPLLRCSGGELHVVAQPYVDYSAERLTNLLSFLPETTRIPILQTLPDLVGQQVDV